MRKVLYKVWVPPQRTPEYTKFLKDHNNVDFGFNGERKIYGTGEWSDFVHEGKFHQWANAYEESSEGFGNYTVALVETYDGRIVEVLPSNLKFPTNNIQMKIIKEGEVKPKSTKKTCSKCETN